MNRITYIALALAALSGFSGITARAYAEAAPATLTADAAVEAALRNNIGVKSVAVQERIKKRASDWSFDKFYPTVSATATTLWLNDPDASSKAIPLAAPISAAATVYDPTLNSMGVYNYVYDYVPESMNLQFGLSIQEIVSPAYFGLMDQAAIEYQKSTISRAKAESQIRAAVKKLFYQLIVMKEAIAVTQSRLDSANERLRQAQLAFDIGQGSELNLMYAKAAVEGILPELQTLKTSRILVLVKFEETLGFDRRDDMELDGSLEAEQPVEPAPAAADSRYDVAESALTVRQLSSALRLTDLTLLPNLIVQYTADPTLNDPTWSRAQEGSNWFQKNGAFSITLQWSLTGFLPGSETQVKRGEYKDQLALAREAEQVARDNALHDEDNQRRLIQDSLSKIGNIENVVKATRRTYELCDDAYKAGLGKLLDLQSAEIAWHGSEIQLLNERLNLMSLIWDLEAKHSR